MITMMLVLALIGTWAIFGYYQFKKDREIAFLKQEFDKKEGEIRKDAIAKSKSIIRGQVSETLIPLFPEFPYNTSDCHFIGQPIDYIIFNNMSDIRDGDQEKQIDIVISDVKVGQSSLTRVQREIRNAIDGGRVRFEVWKLNDDNKLTIK